MLTQVLSIVEGRNVSHIAFKVLRKLAMCSWYNRCVRREECAEPTVIDQQLGDFIYPFLIQVSKLGGQG